MGGSEFSKIFGTKSRIVSPVNKKNAKENYNSFTKANKNKLIKSAISVSIGGLGIALAKMAIASQKGLSINLNNINLNENKIENNNILFSESPSRIITTISPQNKNKFERHFKNNQLSLVGKINRSNKITFNLKNKKKFEASIHLLTKNYKRDLFKQ